jgi:predicted porin
MKKHLIAAAVAAAFAVPAMAQVKVSGTLETGYVNIAQDDSGAIGSANRGLGAQHSTSSIVFSGSEDLGGGLKASFNLGMEFAGADGISSGTLDNTGQQFQTASVSLSSASFGTIDLGTFAHKARDLGGVYRFAGNVGRLAADGSAADGSAYNAPDTVQDSIQYTSPSFNGFTLNAAKSMRGVDEAGAEVDDNVLSYGVQGSIMGLKLAISSEKLTEKSGVETKWTSYGASYNFGPARLGLVHVKTNYDDGAAEGAAIGVHVGIPLGSNVLAGLSTTNYKEEVSGDKANVTTISAIYSMSKRTSVVASYQTLKSEGAATTIGGTRGLGVQEVVGENTSGYGLTVVHKF